MERWAKVDCYEWLEVSDQGNVRTLDSIRVSMRMGKHNEQLRRGGPMSPFLLNNGYLCVQPKIGNSRKKLTIHRLVALAFVPGYFEDATVNHIDGVKTHNVWTNLEWVTLAENTRLQWRDGLVDLRGDNNPQAKLTSADVSEIRRLRDCGVTCTEIAARFGISDSLVSMVATRRRWASAA